MIGCVGRRRRICTCRVYDGGTRRAAVDLRTCICITSLFAHDHLHKVSPVPHARICRQQACSHAASRPTRCQRLLIIVMVSASDEREDKIRSRGPCLQPRLASECDGSLSKRAIEPDRRIARAVATLHDHASASHVASPRRPWSDRVSPSSRQPAEADGTTLDRQQ